jgi:Sel1 repeat
MSDPPDKIKRRRPDWLWVVLIAGVITAGELGLLIGTYSRDGTTWRTLHWLDTNTTVTSRLDTPKTLTQVGSPSAGLPIASADPHSNQLAEYKPVVQPEPALATVTSSLPSHPSQVASVQAGTAPVFGPQSLRVQEGSAARHLDAEEIAALINRGTDSLKSGDLVSARLLLRRAAEAGSASAALMLGTTFDPLVIQQLGAIGVVPDVAQARQWYEKAAELGSDAASQRLAKLPQTGQ